MKGLRELWRVLAPGGKMTIAVWGALERAPAHTALVRLASKRAGVAAANRIRRRFVLGDTAKLAALFERVGIPAEIQTRTGKGRYADVNGFARADIDGWISNGEMPQAEHSAALKELRTGVTRFADPRGTLVLPIEAHIATARK